MCLLIKDICNGGMQVWQKVEGFALSLLAPHEQTSLRNEHVQLFSFHEFRVTSLMRTTVFVFISVRRWYVLCEGRNIHIGYITT